MGGVGAFLQYPRVGRLRACDFRLPCMGLPISKLVSFYGVLRGDCNFAQHPISNNKFVGAYSLVEILGGPLLIGSHSQACLFSFFFY
jgi:hypothetical protein